MIGKIISLPVYRFLSCCNQIIVGFTEMLVPEESPIGERALHAIMVAMMRLENDEKFNSDPPKFPSKNLQEWVCRIIENRVEDIDPDELEGTISRMEYILQSWEDWNPRKWEPAKNLDGSYTDVEPLLYSAGSHPNDAWGECGMETPTSMRNVDASCEAEILGHRYVAKED